MKRGHVVRVAFVPNGRSSMLGLFEEERGEGDARQVKVHDQYDSKVWWPAAHVTEEYNVSRREIWDLQDAAQSRKLQQIANAAQQTR